jgi:putative transcriptional regulator
MKTKLFDELMASMEDALDHAKGKRELRTTVLPPPPAPMTAADVQRVRKRLNASQAVFAHYLNVSTKLVQAWEADRRQPEGPALILLRLGDRDPAALAAMVFSVTRTPAKGRTTRPTPSRSRKPTKRRSSKAA